MTSRGEEKKGEDVVRFDVTNLYLEEETEASPQKMGAGYRVDFTAFSPQPNVK